MSNVEIWQTLLILGKAYPVPTMTIFMDVVRDKL